MSRKIWLLNVCSSLVWSKETYEYYEEVNFKKKTFQSNANQPFSDSLVSIVSKVEHVGGGHYGGGGSKGYIHVACD